MTLKEAAEEIRVLKSEVEGLRRDFDLVVNETEEMFQWIFALKRSKRSIEEIVEQSVLEHFGITQRQFFGKRHTKKGVKVATDETDNVVEARKWFLSILLRILNRSPYTLSVHYPFYSNKIEERHRAAFNGTENPKTENDQQNRKIRLAIYDIIRRNCRNDGMFYEEFEGI